MIARILDVRFVERQIVQQRYRMHAAVPSDAKASQMFGLLCDTLENGFVSCRLYWGRCVDISNHALIKNITSIERVLQNTLINPAPHSICKVRFRNICPAEFVRIS